MISEAARVLKPRGRLILLGTRCSAATSLHMTRCWNASHNFIMNHTIKAT